jgi:hypothetical protein
MRAIAIIVLAFHSIGCAVHQPSAYQIASAAPTPLTLRPGQKWAITLLDGEGHIWKSVVVRLTDIPVKTCDSDDDRKLELISESLGTGPALHEPTYHVTGSAMRIQLASAACDAGYSLVGGVTDNGYEGVHMADVLFAPKHSASGRVYGLPIPD